MGALRRLRAGRGECALLREGKAVALAPTPFAVLCALARQPGSLLTKNALLDQVWGHRFVSESVLKTTISDLRTVLGGRCAASRALSKRCRGAAIGSSPPATAISAAQSARAGVRQPLVAQAGVLHRSRGSALATSQRLGFGAQRQAYGGLGGRRAGYRQDDADRAFRGRPRRRRLRARPVRGTLRRRRALSSGARSAGRDVSSRRRRPDAAPCRGADLAVAVAVAQHGRGA